MIICCVACDKPYTSRRNLRKHHERQPLCVDWIALRSASALVNYVDGKFRLPVDNVTGADDDPNTCGVCKCTFANAGNLNRHFATNVMCSKWAMYKDLVPLECIYAARSIDRSSASIDFAYGGNSGVAPPPEGAGAGASANVGTGGFEAFEAPKHRIIHIIWNMFLLDKELKDVDEIVRDNNIVHVIAILKSEADYDEVMKYAKGHDVRMSHKVLKYAGNDAVISPECYLEFDEQCRVIEACRSARNADGPRACVAVFCNNGYQRSLPFLCYYLVKFHPNEAPTVEKAIDLILPQVDRENFAKHRGAFIESVTAVLAAAAL